MSKKSQAAKVAAMVERAQAVQRPTNVETKTRATVNTENRFSGTEHASVNVGVKVPKDVAYWWTAQGKLKRRAVADVIRDALIAEYGLPDGFTEDDIYPENRRTGKPV